MCILKIFYVIMALIEELLLHDESGIAEMSQMATEIVREHL